MICYRTRELWRFLVVIGGLDYDSRLRITRAIRPSLHRQNIGLLGGMIQIPLALSSNSEGNLQSWPYAITLSLEVRLRAVSLRVPTIKFPSFAVDERSLRPESTKHVARCAGGRRHVLSAIFIPVSLFQVYQAIQPFTSTKLILFIDFSANKYRHSYTKENCAKITPIQLYRGSPENLNSTD
ncbi:hypothetical protein PGT21_028724 [Puccinia graminis f. sp. tritici]|uniref:Uncharacterized protein n=1 Tax=Puccinia graminis f. sp. tritici TaxID=56615 RepID=A0A5B0M4R2_PUCGR|nr:hypothetical protein PGT21_028724 [Puccinia graminis f. sp. tritici]